MKRITDLLKEWIAETPLNGKNYILFNEIPEKRIFGEIEKTVNVLYMYCAYPGLLAGKHQILLKKYQELLKEFNVEEVKIVKVNKYFLKGNSNLNEEILENNNED